MSLQGAALANAVQAMRWLELSGPAEDLEAGMDVAEVMWCLKAVGEDSAAALLVAASSDTESRIVGTPTVYVVPCDREPAAVFAGPVHADAFAKAKGQGWESESCVIADDEIGEALIAEARGGN